MKTPEPGSLEWEFLHDFNCPDPDSSYPCGEKCVPCVPPTEQQPTEENS